MNRIHFVVLGGAALLSAPASAQDISGALSLPDIAQGQLIGSTMHAHAERDRRQARRHSRGPTSQQVSACANLGRFRAQYGADNLKVQKLTRLCPEAGL